MQLLHQGTDLYNLGLKFHVHESTRAPLGRIISVSRVEAGDACDRWKLSCV